MMIDDIELRDIFKTSSAERLQALDDGLLHLEKHPDDPEILASLMREAHSLKGDGNMLGVTDLGKVAHQFEHVLGAIKRGEQTLSSDLFDRLARGLTAMRQIVHEAATGEPAQVKVFYVIAELMGAELAPPAAKSDNALVPADEAHQSAACNAADAIDDIANSIFAELPQSVVADLEGDLSAANGKEATNGAIALEQAKRSDRYIDDDELRSLFKSTSEEHLQALDDGLLHLEKHPDDQDVLEALLRDAHSLKGDSTMLGVGDLGKIAHQIEHLLGLVKRNEAPLSADLCDRLAHGMAAMKQLVHEATTGEPTNVNVFYVLAELMGASPASPPAPSPPPHSSPTSPAPLTPSPSPAASPASCSLTANPDTLLAETSNYRIDTIRVPTHNLDLLMNDSGELTVAKTRIAHRLTEIDAITNLWEEWSRDLLVNRFLFHEAQQGKPVWPQLESFHHRAEQRLEQLGTLAARFSSTLHADTDRLERITGRLEESIRTLRLLPLSTIFNLFPRLVRDLARQEGKQVEFVIEGGDTRADKRILEDMKDPLLHMILNAIDHGVEPPEERRRQGKPEVATITLRGARTATSIVLEVSDDGRGLDLDSIKQTAVRRGLYRPEELELLSPSQIRSLILKPGFSTRTRVTEISGRGVGLDVLRTNVERLKGTIEVESTPGQGCTLRVRLGTTLATVHVLLVAASGQTFALPVEFVRTTCLVQTSDIFSLEGHSTIVYEDNPISVVWLSDLLDLPKPAESLGKSAPEAHSRRARQRLSCIILQIGQDRLGIFVDALIDEQDVVLKPQSQLLKRVRYISGATILGTGNVCLVLNPQDLISAVRHWAGASALPQEGLTTASLPSEPQPKRILLVEDSIATRTQEKRILESAGYEVVTAVDGLDGFKKLQSRPFDAVVSDVQMPNLDGLGLTQRIRQHREYNEMPVVLVTTLASDDDRRRGAEAGANAYIPKGSFTQDLLFETLNRLILS